MVANENRIKEGNQNTRKSNKSVSIMLKELVKLFLKFNFHITFLPLLSRCSRKNIKNERNTDAIKKITTELFKSI